MIRRGSLLAALALSAAAAPVTRDYWIAPRTDGLAGSGTANSPWNGSGTNLVKVFNQITAQNPTIHLAAGDYTHGGYWTTMSGLKDGWRLVGAGSGRTRIKLTGVASDSTNSSGANTILFVGYRHAERITIEGLTLDCNYDEIAKQSGLTNLSLQGVVLFGSHHTIRDVQVLNAAGKRKQGQPGANPEAFQISCGEYDRPATDNRIEHCEVRDFRGGDTTAIGFGGTGNGYTTGVIRNNRVYFDNRGGGEFGFGCVRSQWATVEGNVVIGGMRGFNIDTGSGSNLTVRANKFLQIRGQGILIGNGTDVEIADNWITVAGTNHHGILLSGTNALFTGLSKAVVRGNVIRDAGSSNNALSFWGAESWPTESLFVRNIVDRSLGFINVKDRPIYWADNVDFTGVEVRP